jgi:hypothetical protein
MGDDHLSKAQTLHPLPSSMVLGIDEIMSCQTRRRVILFNAAEWHEAAPHQKSMIAGLVRKTESCTIPPITILTF